MIARRATGMGMLVIEAGYLALTMGALPISVLIVTAALVGCWPHLQADWPFRRKLLAAGAIVFAFYLLLRLNVFELDPFRSEPLESAAPLAGALALMTVQALQMYWRTPGGLSIYFPALGVIALAFAADRYLSEPRHLWLAFGYAMGYGLMMALFYASEPGARREGRPAWRTHRYAWLAACVLLSFALAAGTAWLLRNSDRAIAQWMADRAFPERIGLGNSTQTRLDSMSDVKGSDYDHIALQIMAENSPGYLRGQAYADYLDRTWNALMPGTNANPALPPPDGYRKQWRNETLYAVQPGAGTLVGSMTIFPDTTIDRALFAPQETGWIGRTGEGVIVNDAGVIQSPRTLNGEPYQVLTAPPAAPRPLTDEERSRYTAMPGELAPRLTALASSICGDKTGALAKASAITQYFTGNYEYVLGIQVPRGEDPMAYFLFSDPLPAAHCEFFATGAALLLRAAGVPARYVTGVGVWEQHPFADYWVARNRDAHAWVEAWDGEEGWFIVEATPASGLPNAGAGQDTGAWRDLWSLILLNVRRMMAAFRDGAWYTLLESLRALAVGLISFIQAAWWHLILILMLVLAFSRLRGRFRRRPAAELPVDALARRMVHQLGAMDRVIRKRYRLVRARHVTLHAFAREIEDSVKGDETAGRVARWYRAWAAMRYQVQPDSEKVDGLDAELRSLRGRKP